MEILIWYFSICLVLFCLGLLTEYFILKNKPAMDLVLFHFFMWFSPFVNIAALLLVLFRLEDYVNKRRATRNKC